MKTSRMMNTIPNPLTPRRLLLVVHQHVVAPYHTWTVLRSRDLSFMHSSSQEVTFLPSKGFTQLRVSEMKSMSCWIWKIILISSNLCTTSLSFFSFPHPGGGSRSSVHLRLFVRLLLRSSVHWHLGLFFRLLLLFLRQRKRFLPFLTI